MPRIKISDLGGIGVISDIPRWSAPPNALTSGQNIRAFHGKLRNFNGWETVATAPVEPYGLFGVPTVDRRTLWIEAGLNQVYVYDGTAHYDITRLSGGYTTDEYTDRWTGGSQANIGFLCNGFRDAPQQWYPIGTGTRLDDMVYDKEASPANRTWAELGYLAFAMRPYKNTIVALGLLKGSVNLGNTVAWCDFLAPGDDETDWVARTTNSAGEQPLADTTGICIDGGPLRDDFIIYKTDAAYRMSFTGDTTFPFRFQRLPDYVRIAARNCVAAVDELHVLASRDDVHLFDGNVFRSLLDHKLRDYYTTFMNAERLETTFISPYPKEHEVWICFPTSGEPGDKSFPDRAIVWNYRDNTLSLTDLPQTRDLDQGVILSPQGDAFDDPPDIPFDEDKLRFDESPFSTALDFLVGASGTSVLRFGETATENGTPRRCLAERTGLVLPDAGGQSVERVHTIRSVHPYMQATGPVEIQIGAQMSPGGSIRWENWQNFDPNSQEELQFRATGRHFGWRVRSQANVQWDLTDLEFGYQLRRRR